MSSCPGAPAVRPGAARRSFLQLGLGLAHEGDVARNAQHAHGPALVIAVRNFGGLEEAALPVDQQMILRHHGGVAVQHPAVAVGEAAVGEQFLVGLAHDVFGRAPGKARGGGVDEGVAALPVLGEDQVGRFVHHGLQQARRILPRPGAFRRSGASCASGWPIGSSWPVRSLSSCQVVKKSRLPDSDWQ